MSSGSDFEDKATRLFNRLNAVTQPAKIIKNKPENTAKNVSPQELMKIKDEIQTSDFETRKKMRTLTDNLKKLETILVEQNESRTKMDENFKQTALKLEKNMKNVLFTVQKSFAQKEKKLEEKIDALIKSQRKGIEGSLQENEGLLDEMKRIEVRVAEMTEEISQLRKNRLEVEERITRQFGNQLKQLKRIFQNDVRERQQKEIRSINALKGLYKSAAERIKSEQLQREQSQKMLIAVVEQLVTHIIEA